MKFIKIKAMGKDGVSKTFHYANEEHISGICTIMIPSSVRDKNGQPVFIERAGIDNNGRVIPIDRSVKEVVKILESGDYSLLASDSSSEVKGDSAEKMFTGPVLVDAIGIETIEDTEPAEPDIDTNVVPLSGPTLVKD